MTVRTTYFSNLSDSGDADPSNEDYVFGVVRRPLSFVERLTDRNIPAVAPPENLLTAFKNVEQSAEENGDPIPAAIAWENVHYRQRYLRYLERPGPSTVVDELRDLARDESADLWLVCWEKDPRWCHRRLLAETVISEFEDVEMIHHPCPTTIPLPTTRDTGHSECEIDADATLADFSEGST